jgi:hypothetical protein
MAKNRFLNYLDIASGNNPESVDDESLAMWEDIPEQKPDFIYDANFNLANDMLGVDADINSDTVTKKASNVEKQPAVEKDSMLMAMLKEGAPQSKSLDWSDLIIPAISTGIGALTGYAGEGASAGQTGLEVLQKTNEMANKEVQDNYYKRAMLASKLTKPKPAEEKFSYIKGKDDVYAVKGPGVVNPLGIGVQESAKPSSSKTERFTIKGNPKKVKLPEGFEVGGQYQGSSDLFKNLESQGVILAPAYAPVVLQNQQTGQAKIAPREVGIQTPPTINTAQSNEPLVARKSMFTPEGYPQGKDLTKDQVNEINKVRSTYITKTDADRDALNKADAVGGAISEYQKTGNVSLAKQALQQYTTALEKGPITTSDRQALIGAFGTVEEWKRNFEAKIENDPKTAMNELLKASQYLKGTINNRLAMEQKTNVDYLKQKGIDPDYAEKVFGYDPMVRVKDPNGKAGQIKKSKLQEALNRGFTLER